MLCDVTPSWLNIMVWSSEQLHSINNMILHMFGNDHVKLIVV